MPVNWRFIYRLPAISATDFGRFGVFSRKIARSGHDSRIRYTQICRRRYNGCTSTTWPPQNQEAYVEHQAPAPDAIDDSLDEKTFKDDQPLQRITLAASVLDRIRERILSEAIPAGAVLKQDVIANEMGVSRIPVRDALRQLAVEGLVTLLPHHRACVSELSLDELKDLLDLRLWIEPNLVRLAIEQCTDAQIRHISAILEEFHAIPDSNVSGLANLNCRFHVALCEPSGRKRAVATVELLLKNSSRYRSKIVSAGGRDKAYRDHQEMLDMYWRRDSIGGASLARSHILDWHKHFQLSSRPTR
jgi:DNA-binding GntR family transcriptional regulator